MTTPRCSAIWENGLRCKGRVYLDGGSLCFTHAERERKNKQRLPSYGGGPLRKVRTRTVTTPAQASLYVEPVTRTEPSDGYVEWHDRDDGDEHVDPLDRIEDMVHEYKRTRWGG